MSCKYLVLVGALFVCAYNQEAFGYPRAQCQITWTLPESCHVARNKIKGLMLEWKETAIGKEACPGTSSRCPTLPCGQKCRYVFEEIDGNGKIIGHHFTPAKSYRDNVSFEFKNIRLSKQSCEVRGFSKSTVWYAFLDYGTNYCNLRNLIDGANLSFGNDFREHTTTRICTQYDVINCKRY